MLFIYLFNILRSNFNSRGVNSRELRRVFGHSSESSGAFLTKIGENDKHPGDRRPVAMSTPRAFCGGEK